ISIVVITTVVVIIFTLDHLGVGRARSPRSVLTIALFVTVVLAVAELALLSTTLVALASPVRPMATGLPAFGHGSPRLGLLHPDALPVLLLLVALENLDKLDTLTADQHGRFVARGLVLGQRRLPGRLS